MDVETASKYKIQTAVEQVKQENELFSDQFNKLGKPGD